MKMYRHEVYDQLIPAEKIGFGAPRWGSVFQVPGWDGSRQRRSRRKANRSTRMAATASWLREHLVSSSADIAWTGSWLGCPTLPWPQLRWASLPQIWSANCVSFLHLNTVGLWTTILTSANWSFFRDFQMFQPFSRPYIRKLRNFLWSLSPTSVPQKTKENC